MTLGNFVADGVAYGGGSVRLCRSCRGEACLAPTIDEITHTLATINHDRALNCGPI
jgi:predicted metal-binding protein